MKIIGRNIVTVSSVL